MSYVFRKTYGEGKFLRGSRMNSGIPSKYYVRFFFSFFPSLQMASDRLLKERLEIDTLQEMKVLSNKNFQTKFIKVKTKL